MGKDWLVFPQAQGVDCWESAGCGFGRLGIVHLAGLFRCAILVGVWRAIFFGVRSVISAPDFWRQIGSSAPLLHGEKLMRCMSASCGLRKNIWRTRSNLAHLLTLFAVFH